jgi:DNA-binding response OmpR family regulator
VRIANLYDRPESEAPFDLVITDIRMPVCNGLAIVEGLRAARWTMPIIVMTAFGDATARHRAEMLDALFFDKPFDVDDLRTAVTLLLSRVRSRGSGTLDA